MKEKCVFVTNFLQEVHAGILHPKLTFFTNGVMELVSI
jgi:hypothetical protein